MVFDMFGINYYLCLRFSIVCAFRILLILENGFEPTTRFGEKQVCQSNEVLGCPALCRDLGFLGCEFGFYVKQ